jgi:hypothetical protein
MLLWLNKLISWKNKTKCSKNYPKLLILTEMESLMMQSKIRNSKNYLLKWRLSNLILQKGKQLLLISN